MIATDERKGYPSASQLERLRLCPGSWALSQRAPPEELSPGALRGIKIHAFLAKEIQFSELTEEEEEIALNCHRQFDDFLRGLGIRKECVIREHRMWSPEPRWSGKFDVIVYGKDLEGRRVFVVGDYKTGWGDVTESASNMQMWAAAALLYDQNADRVVCAIVKQDGVDATEFDNSECRTCKKHIDAIVTQAMKPDAKRSPGEVQCRYCKAKPICPDFMGDKALMPLDISGKPEKEQVRKLVAKLPGEQLDQVLDKIKLAQMVIDVAKEEATKRIQEGDDPPKSWTLKPGRIVDEIVDPEGVWNKVAKDIPPEMFMRAVRIQKGALTKVLGAVLGIGGKQLRTVVDDILCGCVGKKQTKPVLVRINEPHPTQPKLP